MVFRINIPRQSSVDASVFKLSGKVREFDPDANEKVGTSGTDHNIYLCPFCLDVIGEEDTSGKFYWNTKKYVGYCFKCETVGILKSDKSKAELQLGITINSAISKIKSCLPPRYSLGNLGNLPLGKIYKPLTEDGKEYLSDRLSIYEELVGKLPILDYKGVGILFPIVCFNHTVSMIVRFYHPNGKLKYYIGTDTKYLYSPNNSIRYDNKYQEYTIVEGPFDAIAALLDGYPNPVAIFGKTITPYQIYLLRSLNPSKINIYLDQGKLSWSLYHKIKHQFPAISKPTVIPSFGKDPEEILINKLASVQIESDLDKLLKNINNGLELISQGYSNYGY